MESGDVEVNLDTEVLLLVRGEVETLQGDGVGDNPGDAGLPVLDASLHRTAAVGVVDVGVIQRGGRPRDVYREKMLQLTTSGLSGA